MRPPKTPQQQSGSRFPAVRLSMQVAIACLLVGAVVACTEGNGQPSPGSSVTSSGEDRQSTASPQVSSPDGTASTQTPAAGTPSASAAVQPSEDPATGQLKQAVGDALRKVAAGSPKPSRDQITAALTGAGIPAGALEVSASSTPTGLEVDAIEAAAIQGKDCVIGQVRDRNVTVIVLPVLASGKCFAGSPV